jgi:GNAT superfamily N-acetyltransferase
MKPGYEVIRYRPELRKEVLELQKFLWSSDTGLNSAYLEWKHEGNPYMETPLIYLALYGDKTVGMRSMFGVNWEAGIPPKTYPGICPDDMVIDAAHRNRGLAAEMMKAVFRDLERLGYEYVFSLSAGKITRLTSLAQGWRSAGSVQMQRRTSDRRPDRFHRMREYFRETRFLWRFADRLPSREGEKKQQSIHRLRIPKGGLSGKSGSRILVSPEARPGEMARLVSRIGYDGRIRHVRDETYLAWRFRNPLHRYLFLYWMEDELEGYLVLQQYLSDLSDAEWVNIVDWEATSPEVRAGLLRTATRLCPDAQLNIWTATLGSDARRLLQEVGFRALPEGLEGGVAQDYPCLLVRSVAENIPATEWSLSRRRLLEMGNWDIRMLYSMQG